MTKSLVEQMHATLTDVLQPFSSRTPIATIIATVKQLDKCSTQLPLKANIDWIDKATGEVTNIGLRAEIIFCRNRFRSIVDGLAETATVKIPVRLANKHVVDTINRLKRLQTACADYMEALQAEAELEEQAETAAKKVFTQKLTSLEDLSELYNRINAIPITDTKNVQQEIDDAIRDSSPEIVGRRGKKPTPTPEKKYSDDHDVAREERQLDRLGEIPDLIAKYEQKYKGKLPKPGSNQAAIYRPMPLLLTYGSDAEYALYSGKFKNTPINTVRLPSGYGLILEDQMVVGIHRKIADDPKQLERTIEMVLDNIHERYNHEFVAVKRAAKEVKYFLSPDAPSFAFIWLLPAYIATKLGTFTVDWIGFPWSSKTIERKTTSDKPAKQSLTEQRQEFDAYYNNLPNVIKLTQNLIEVERVLQELSPKIDDMQSDIDSMQEKIETFQALDRHNQASKNKAVRSKTHKKEIEQLQSSIGDLNEKLHQLRQLKTAATKARKLAQTKLDDIRERELRKVRKSAAST